MVAATATPPIMYMVPATSVPVPLVAAAAPALVIAAKSALMLLGKHPTNARRLREGSCSTACPPARTDAPPTAPTDQLLLLQPTKCVGASRVLMLLFTFTLLLFCCNNKHALNPIKKTQICVLSPVLKKNFYVYFQ